MDNRSAENVYEENFGSQAGLISPKYSNNDSDLAELEE